MSIATKNASTTASDAARALSVAAKCATAAPESPRDFSALTKALVTQWTCANAEKGDRKARALDACRTFGAALLTETLASDNPNGIRIGVSCVTKERGAEVTSIITCSIVSILKSIVMGGNVVGASKLAK